VVRRHSKLLCDPHQCCRLAQVATSVIACNAPEAGGRRLESTMILWAQQEQVAPQVAVSAMVADAWSMELAGQPVVCN
jgi:hypothetical protein